MFFKAVCLTLLSAILLTGCSENPQELKRQYIESGDRHLADKRPKDAVVEYRNAIQQDPRDGAVRLKLAQTYGELGDVRNAYREFVRAADLLPNDAATQVKTGNLLLLAGQYEDAQTRAERALASDAKNVDAMILRANALAGLRKLDDALQQAEEATRLDGESAESFTTVGVMRAIRGDRVEAEQAFHRAVETDPSSIQARLALVNFYFSTQRLAEAEAELVKAVAMAPTDITANRTLANLFLATNRVADAEAPLKRVAESAPDSTGKLLLADYYIRARKPDQARPLLEVTRKDTRAFVPATLALASLERSAGKPAEAMRLIDDVLTKDAQQVDALALKAGLLLDAGKLDDAYKTAKTGVQADPTSVRAQLTFGLAARANRKFDEDVAALGEAAK